MADNGSKLAHFANVRALLAARTGRGFRSKWSVPGFGNGVSYTEHGASYALGASIRWPARDARDGAEILRGACLTRHRALVKNALRALARPDV